MFQNPERTVKTTKNKFQNPEISVSKQQKNKFQNPEISVLKLQIYVSKS